MNSEARFRDLLSKLLDDECSVSDEEELARLCQEDPSRRQTLQSELEIAEMIRHAIAETDSAEHSFTRSIESRLTGQMPGFEVLMARLAEGEATRLEVDEIVRHCWREPNRAAELRRELKWRDLLGQAVSECRSEEAFVESLATRMWAEQEQDHFVEKTQSKIVQLHPEAVQPIESNSRSSKIVSIGTWATAAAALVAFGAFFLMNSSDSVAEVAHATEDVRWKAGSTPTASGKLDVGRYELVSGIVTLAFDNGTEMTIEGPSEFEVRGENEAFVHSGIAMLDQRRLEKPGSQSTSSEPESTTRGFTLQSKGLNLVETYDTVGIDARSESATEAIVFNGGAEICLPAAGSCRNLYEYEAVRVDLKRDKLYDIPYNPKVFARTWEVLAGVERNTGSVRIELPGEKPEKVDSDASEVQVFVENERFVPHPGIEVDTLDPGQFSQALASPGKPLGETGELRSYLLQLWPEGKAENSNLEASVTFAHEIVGVIYSSKRLEESDSMVGTEMAGLTSENTIERGLDAIDGDADSILLSDDRRTVNLRLHSGSDSDELDHVRVLVALH